MNHECEQCRKTVDGWRSQEPGPFKFCSEECRSDFVGSVIAQIGFDQNFREELFAKIKGKMVAK